MRGCFRLEVSGAGRRRGTLRPYRQLRPPKCKSQREWYIRNRERIAEERKRIRPDRRQYNKEYRARNSERLRRYDRERNKSPHRRQKDKERHMELQTMWNNHFNGKESWKKAEQLAVRILQNEGFSRIERTNFYFPFDYWAKLAELPVAVEVTCSYKRAKKGITKRFLSFSGWRYFVLFIRPDLEKYVLKEIPQNQTVIRAISSQKDMLNLKEVNG
jgi:hypothetical protein